MFKTNINELFFILLFSYAILRFIVYFHELGHAFALLISKYALRSKTKLNIQIVVCGFYGKTYSPLYHELTLPLIKLNAIMGYVFELVLFVTLIINGTIKLYISPSILLDPYVFVFTFDSVFLFLVSMYFALIKGTSDTTYFKYPDTFSYSDKTTKISKTYTRFNIAYYLLVTLVYTLISSFNSIL